MIRYDELDEFSLQSAFEQPEIYARVDILLDQLDERMAETIQQYERLIEERLQAEDNPSRLSELITRIESILSSFNTYLSVLTALRDETMYLMMIHADGSIQARERQARALVAPVTRRTEYLRGAIDSMTSQIVTLRRQMELVAKGGL